MEFVWVVPRAELFGQDEAPQGFVSTRSPRWNAAWPSISVERGFFVERRAAEARPEWKQIIPYCVLETPDGIFHVERLPRGSEARLHGKLSIGLGGHINPEDAGPELVTACARRELREELELEEIPPLETIGIVNDDSNAVGSVHVGFVMRGFVAGPPKVREIDRLRAAQTPLVDLRSMCDASASFESWSEMILCSRDWEIRS